MLGHCMFVVFFFKQKTAYEMRISDWSSDVCSSDLQSCLKKSRGGCQNGWLLSSFCYRFLQWEMGGIGTWAALLSRNGTGKINGRHSQYRDPDRRRDFRRKRAGDLSRAGRAVGRASGGGCVHARGLGSRRGAGAPLL